MNAHKYKNPDASKQFEEKCTRLMSEASEKPVSFTPQEFLKLVLQTQGINFSEFSRNILQKNAHYLQDIFRRTSETLPLPLTALIATQFDRAPYNEALYWQKSEYKLDIPADIPGFRHKESVQEGPYKWQSTVSLPNQRHVNYILR
jgi:hypothetical protein